MITRELTKIKKIAIVEISTNFSDIHKKTEWPLGKKINIDLDVYKKGGIIEQATHGHGIIIVLRAEDVIPIRAFIEKTITETEFFEI